MNDEQKLEELRQLTGLDPAAVGQQIKEEAEELGLDSKEKDVETETKDETVVTEQVAETEQATEAPASAEPAPAHPGLTTEHVGVILSAIETLAQRVEELEKSRTEPEPQDDKETEMPLDAMMSQFKSRVIKSDEARVDGRTTEAKDRPAENTGPAKPKVSGDSIPAQLVNYMFSGKMRQELTEVSQ